MDNKMNMAETRIKLDELQIYYLVLLAKGFSTKEIMTYLIIDQKQLTDLKFIIKMKFKKDDWKHIIYEALDKNIININDLLDEVVKQTAFKYSRLFFKSHFESLLSFIPKGSIHRFVLDFIRACDYKLIKSGKDINLSPIAKELLFLEHENLNCSHIISNLNITKIEYIIAKQEVLSSLSVTNMFSAIRKASQYNIINKSSYLSHYLKKDVKKCSDRLCRINFNKYGNTDRELLVANELIKIYNILEYRFLMSNFTYEREKKLKISA